MDHRWGCRVPIDVDVQLICRPDALGAGRLKDVSISGAFVETRLNLPVLTRVRIVAHLQTRASAELHDATAYVVRRTRTGVAVEWCEDAPEFVRTLLVGTVAPPLRQSSTARA